MQGATSIQYVLETELEWLIYQLWSKNTARAPTFSFNLAETIVLRQGCPQTWYFSSKEGYILRKNTQNVRLTKINKRFLQKNGMTLTAQDDMPAATTYSYRPQRNTDTGAERMCIRLGYVAGKDLMRGMRTWAEVEEERPQILQMFIAPKLIQNSAIKVQWTLSTIKMVKITNKLPLFEQRYSLVTRSANIEDYDESLYTEQVALPNMGPLFDRILTALLEIHQHIKKNADISLMAGTFFFKVDDREKPVLMFANSLKTDRPILVLNSNVRVALIVQEMRITSESLSNVALMRIKQGEEQKQYFSHQSSMLPPLNPTQNSNKNADIQMLPLSELPNVSDRQSIGTRSGSISAARMRMSEESSTQLPPKRPISGSRSSVGFEVCSFCVDVRGKLNLPFQLTANQIIKLYEYYSENPAGLLILPASTEKQQMMFEEIYQQVTFGMEKSTTSLNSQGRGMGMVPLPIQRAFDMTSLAKYQVAKHDANFLYKTLKLCSDCYNTVKALLVNQQSEQVQTTNKSNQLQSGEKEHSPIHQGWMHNQDKSENNLEEVEVSESGDASSAQAKSQNDPGYQMFTKVQAGREVSQEDEMRFDSSVQASELKTKSDMPIAEAVMQDAVSLNIQGSLPEEDLMWGSKQALSLENYRQSTKSNEFSVNPQNINQQILSFVKRGSAENKPSTQLKSMARSRTKHGSAQARMPANPANFPFHEKKKLRDARRNLLRQKEQMNAVQAVMLKQQQQLMKEPSVALTEAITSPQSMTYALEQESLSNALMMHAKKVAPKGIYSRMRPSSANPNTSNYRQGISEAASLGQLNQQSIQPMASGYVLPPAYDAPSKMLAYPSNSALPHNFYGRPLAQREPLIQNPNAYTNIDACKIYLQNVNKGDIDTLVAQQQRAKQKLQQKLSCQRLSSASQKKHGLPPKPRDRSNPKLRQTAAGIGVNSYSWNRPQLYPASIEKSRSPIRKVAQSTKNSKTKLKRGGQPQAQNTSNDSINMFNYQSNGNQSEQQTNLMVPQNYQRDGEVKQPAQNSLAASLLGIQDMQMKDIDQIAENADNLINILQGIKQVKQMKDQNLDYSSQEQSQQAIQLSGQVDVPAEIHTTSPEPLNDEADLEVEQVTKQDDFWDSHTHSPPALQQQPIQQQEEDLWGDNQPVRVLPKDDPILIEQEEEEEPTKSEHRMTKQSSDNFVPLNRSRTSVNENKASKKKKKVTKKMSTGGINSDLNVDEQIASPLIDTVVAASQVQTDRVSAADTPAPIFVVHQSQRSNELQSQETQQKTRLEENICEINAIPEPLLSQKTSIKKIESGNYLRKPSSMRTYEVHDDDMLYSAEGATDFEPYALSSNEEEEQQEVVQQQAAFMVYGGNQANFGASAFSNSMPEMLHSEAFNSAVRTRPYDAVQEPEEIDLSRMDVPQLSPVIMEANPDVEGQVYAVVDNRFLESSNNEDLEIAPVDDDYTQDFSAIQDTQMLNSAVREEMNNKENASPSAFEVPSESMNEVPVSESPNPQTFIDQESQFGPSSFQEQDVETQRTIQDQTYNETFEEATFREEEESKADLNSIDIAHEYVTERVNQLPKALNQQDIYTPAAVTTAKVSQQAMTQPKVAQTESRTKQFDTGMQSDQQSYSQNFSPTVKSSVAAQQRTIEEFESQPRNSNKNEIDDNYMDSDYSL